MEFIKSLRRARINAAAYHRYSRGKPPVVGVLALVLTVTCLTASYTVRFAMAKFTSSGSGTATAQVAKFAPSVTSTGAASNRTILFLEGSGYTDTKTTTGISYTYNNRGSEVWVDFTPRGKIGDGQGTMAPLPSAERLGIEQKAATGTGTITWWRDFPNFDPAFHNAAGHSYSYAGPLTIPSDNADPGLSWHWGAAYGGGIGPYVWEFDIQLSVATGHLDIIPYWSNPGDYSVDNETGGGGHHYVVRISQTGIQLLRGLDGSYLNGAYIPAFPALAGPPVATLTDLTHVRVEYIGEALTVYLNGQEVLCAPIFVNHHPAPALGIIPRGFSATVSNISVKTMINGNGSSYGYIPIQASGYKQIVSSAGGWLVDAVQVD